MIAKNNTVHLVDDDPAMLLSLADFLTLHGFSVATYAGSIEFLSTVEPDTAGCIVTDVQMPVMTGIQLVSRLRERGFSLPTIFITARADSRVKADALMWDAVEVLEKPFNIANLVTAIRKALIRGAEESRQSTADSVRARFSRLSSNEKIMMHLLVQGKPNRSIAKELNMSVDAVERHRAMIVHKMNASSISELLQMWSHLNPPC